MWGPARWVHQGQLVALRVLILHGAVQHRDPQAQHRQHEVSKVFVWCYV